MNIIPAEVRKTNLQIQKNSVIFTCSFSADQEQEDSINASFFGCYCHQTMPIYSFTISTC